MTLAIARLASAIFALTLAFWCLDGPFRRSAAAATGVDGQESQLPAPQWVGAADRGGKVVLSWIRDPRFAAVRIYRASGPAGAGFTRIGETAENSFVDLTAAPGSSHRYRLTALGADGREGRPSAETSVSVTAIALKPPAVPVWEGYLVVENGVGIKWTKQEAADILVYNVYRRAEPDRDLQLVASVRDNSFVDTRVEAGRSYAYAVTALDSSFRETAFSAELPVVYQPLRQPVGTKGAVEWRRRRTRLVATVTQGDLPLLRPADVAVGPLSGNVYLSDSGWNRVFVFGADGGFVRSLGGLPGPEGVFRRLLGLAVDDAETLYVVDSGAGAIFAFPLGEATGRRIDVPQAPPEFPSGLVDCVSGNDRRLSLVDNTNNRLFVGVGTPAMKTIGRAGFGMAEFSAPTFAAVDGGGSLYVADTLNGRVQVFSPAGEFVRAFGRADRGPLLLGRPKGLAVRENGEVLVADSWLNLVGVFDAAGQPSAILVDEDEKPLDLGSPNGIALGPGNRIYIAERLSARLQIREIIDDAR